jgi:DNA-binding MurR/RpiR family transcriptional regulator
MEGCAIRLKESMENLTEAQSRVASFILAGLSRAVSLTVEQIAKECSTSKTTVIRLCKLMGFEGYKQFTKSLLLDIAGDGGVNVNYMDISQTDDLCKIINNVSTNNMQSIENTLKILDYDELNKAVEAIIKARRIHFYGVGGSGIVAQDAQCKFLRISKDCHAYTDPHQQIFAAAGLNEEDVAFFISYSGETKDIIETLDLVNRIGATTIGLTRYGKNPVSSRAKIKLSVTSSETMLRSSATSSRIAQLNIIDIIYTAVAGKTYGQIKKYLDLTRIAINEKKSNDIIQI